MRKVDFSKKIVGLFTDVENDIILIQNLDTLIKDAKLPNQLLVAELHISQEDIDELEEIYESSFESAECQFGELDFFDFEVDLKESAWVNFSTRTLGEFRAERRRQIRSRCSRKKPQTLEEKWRASTHFS